MQLHDTTIGWRFVNPLLKQAYGVDSMPETGENVAHDFRISREDQDKFALRSQQRALAAQKAGYFAEEIVGVAVPAKRGETTLVTVDEHPRETSLEALAKLPTPFRAGGTVTAGNASGVNDGSCALAARLRARPSSASVSSPGPASWGRPWPGWSRASWAWDRSPPRASCSRGSDSTLADIDLIELNEAFASQALAVLRELGIADDAAHVNPQGGAIALGHPLGASGARLATTAVRQLERGAGRRALCTMCIGVGQGIAMVLERV